MPIVKRYTFNAGVKVKSSEVNTNFDDIITAFNAHSHTNVGTDAPLITSSGIAGGSVPFVQLGVGATRVGIGTNAGATLSTSMATFSTVTGITHGGAIEAHWGAVVGNGNSGAERQFTVQVLQDGSNITPSTLTFDSIFVSGFTTNQFYGFIMTATPAAGSHTWNLQMSASVGGAVVLGNNYLKIMEVV